MPSTRTARHVATIGGDQEPTRAGAGARLEIAQPGRLVARPTVRADRAAVRTGKVALGLEPKRDGYWFVPSKYDAKEPAPLLVMLHGAGGNGGSALSLVERQAEAHGVIVLAPDSRQSTWDMVARDAFGADVQFIDRALEATFARYQVDATRIAIGGFSDGASYALSLGVRNGDLFRYVLAFSPGFAAVSNAIGKPRLFISHGLGDAVLPIESCSRRLVPRLASAGYDVAYYEFDGPHWVPPPVADVAFDWFLSGGTAPVG